MTKSWKLGVYTSRGPQHFSWLFEHNLFKQREKGTGSFLGHGIFNSTRMRKKKNSCRPAGDIVVNVPGSQLADCVT